MNFKIQLLPRANETLDFQNFNIPFIIAQKNKVLIEKYTEKLIEDVEKLRIYTETDKITVISNGIEDRFYFSQDAYTLNIEGEVTLKSSTYTKETEDFSSIEPESILNLEESSFFMIEDGFLPISNTFTRILTKQDIPYSNMLSLSEFVVNVFSKIGVFDAPEVSLLNVDNNGIFDNNSIISYGDALDILVHREVPTGLVTIENDNILSLKSDSVGIDDVLFIDGFVPVDNDETVSVGYMDEFVYSIHIDAASPIFIKNESLKGAAPINKKQLMSMSSGYISTLDNLAHNVLITEDREDIPEDAVISNKEADSIIESFFYGINSSSIDSIAEFREYLSALCDMEDDFLDSSFMIKEGKVYLGFDYNNMNSIFNSLAIKDILFNRTGEYDKDSDGITHFSARYFKNQSDISKLSAYGEALGIEIDVSRQRLASTFDGIRRIVAKLCIMTPDILPPVDVPDYPIFDPIGEPILSVIPPVVKPFYMPIILPKLTAPIYISIPNTIIVIPPIVSPIFRSVYLPTLIVQPYYEILRTLPVMPPMMMSATLPNRIVMPIIYGPIYMDIGRPCFARRDGPIDTMVAFDADGECRERFIAVSNRTINMIDASALFSQMNISSGYGVYDTGHVATIPEMIAFMIYNTLICAASISDMPVNIDFCDKVLVEVIDEPKYIVGFCTNDTEDEGGTTIEEKLAPGKYFVLNGVVVDEYGNVSGEHIITESEMFDVPQISLSSFSQISGTENATKSNDAADAIGTDIKNYVDPFRKSTRSVNIPIESHVVGFESIDGFSGPGKFMLDYLKLVARDDVPSGYGNGGSADPMGIWSGSDLPLAALRDIVAPDIAVVIPAGTGVSSGDASVVRVWQESEADNIDIRELPYHVLDSVDTNYFIPEGQLPILDLIDGSLSYSPTDGLTVVAYAEKELTNSFGEPEVYKGFTVNDKFVVVTDNGYSGLSITALGIPICYSFPLPLLRTIRTPLIIVPLSIILHGPIVVQEGDETGEYFIAMTRTMECDVVISLELEDITTSPDDHEGIPISELTILAGETESDSFKIQTLVDSESEGVEYFKIKITGIDVGLCTGIPAKVTRKEILTSIYEPPPCYLMASPITIKEGDTGNFRVSLSKDAGVGGYPFNAKSEDGTAVAGLDYTTVTDMEYVIPEGSSYLDIPIETLSDSENESVEDLFILLSQTDEDCDTAVSRVPVLIMDELAGGDWEMPNACGFYLTGSVVRAGEKATVRLILSQTKAMDFVFNIKTYEDSAIDGVDYTGIDINGTILAGDTEASFDIQTIKGLDNDPTKILSALVTSDSCSTQDESRAPVTILSELNFPVPDIPLPVEPGCLAQLRPPPFVQEGDIVNVEFVLPEALPEPLVVIANTEDGTAIDGEDYIGLTNAVFTMPAGQTTLIIPIETINDIIYEAVEPFMLHVSLPYSDCDVINSPASILIYDDAGDFDEWQDGLPAPGEGSMSMEEMNQVVINMYNAVSGAKVDMVVSAGSSTVGCEEESNMKSGIDGTNINNISDLTTIDADTLYQEPGDTPGAANMGIMMHVTKVKNEMIDGFEKRVMKNHVLSICGVFGAVDGETDINGDILSQGFTASEIPEDSTPKTYIGPAPEFATKTEYVRDDEKAYSSFTMNISDMVKDAVDLTTDEPFDEGMPVRIAQNEIPLTEQINEGEIVVGNISTAGMTYHYKHAGPNAKYPVTASYGGSSSASLTTGKKVVVSSGSPLPTLLFTNADNADEHINKDGFLDTNTSFILINNDTITVVLRDVVAALSQKRTVKFLWDK